LVFMWLFSLSLGHRGSSVVSIMKVSAPEIPFSLSHGP
jgi:hypothetical protein